MIKQNIPNSLTLGNLLCGCLALVKAFEGDLVWAAYFVGIAAILDFFDGFVARILKVSSPIGKDLDSLADMVTFGLVPGVIMFQMIQLSPIIMEVATSGWTIYPPLSNVSQIENSHSMIAYEWLKYIAFLIPVFSCIRLAKFNNDTRQSESFIGLPTPANAIFICSLPFVLPSPNPHVTSGCFGYPFYVEFLMNPWCLCLLSGIMGLLLVAPLPLFSLKFKKFSWKGNEIRYSFLGFCVLLVCTLQLAGIPLAILSYILFSVGNNLINRAKKPVS